MFWEWLHFTAWRLLSASVFLAFFLASPHRLIPAACHASVGHLGGGGEDLCSLLHGDSLRVVRVASPFAAQEQGSAMHGLRRGIDQWLFKTELWFFFFFCFSLCCNWKQNKRKSGRSRIKMGSTCCGLNVMKFRLPSWIQRKNSHHLRVVS